MRRSTILVVEADAEERERLGTWLEGEGFDVLTCPGPTAPDYVCVGGRGELCPLVQPADVIVLDLWLESDTLMMGTPAEELLSSYVDAGKGVIVLTYRRGPVDPFEDELTMSVDRHPEREPLLDAVREMVSRTAALRPGRSAYTS